MRGMGAVSLAGPRRGSPLLQLALARREENRRRALDWQEYLKRQDMQKATDAQRQEFQVQLGTLSMLAERIQNTSSPTERQLIIKNNRNFVEQMTRHPQMGPIAQQIVGMSQLNPRKIKMNDYMKDNPMPQVTPMDKELGPNAVAAKLTQREAWTMNARKNVLDEAYSPKLFQTLDENYMAVWNNGQYIAIKNEDWQANMLEIANANNMSLTQLINTDGYGKGQSSYVDIDGKRELITVKQDLIGGRSPKIGRQVLGDVPGSKAGSGGNGGNAPKLPEDFRDALTLWNSGVSTDNPVQSAYMDELDRIFEKHDKEPGKAVMAINNYMWRDPKLSGFTAVLIPNVEGETVKRSWHFPFGLDLKLYDGAYLGVVPGRPVKIDRPDGSSVSMIYDQNNDQFYNYGDGQPVTRDFIVELATTMPMPEMIVPTPVDGVFIAPEDMKNSIGATDIYKNLWGREHPSIKVIK